MNFILIILYCVRLYADMLFLASEDDWKCYRLYKYSVSYLEIILSNLHKANWPNERVKAC